MTTKRRLRILASAAKFRAAAAALPAGSLMRAANIAAARAGGPTGY